VTSPNFGEKRPKHFKTSTIKKGKILLEYVKRLGIVLKSK
jgi:hypothetical protein